MRPFAIQLLVTIPLLGSPAAGQTAQPERPWTFMIYAAVDNDAEGHALEFVDRIRKALDDDPGMELVLFIDRNEGYSRDAAVLGADFTDTRIYRIRKASAELLDARELFPELIPGEHNELDSSDPANLGRFVSFCKRRFPARRYGLLVYSHADGQAMCPDDESGGEMSIPGLGEEVDAAASVDLLALELCNMGGLEIAYQWRPGNGGFSTDVLVAIPNTGLPLDWERAFARIRTPTHGKGAAGRALDPAELTPARFGALVVEEGYAGRRAMFERYHRENPAEAEAFIATRHDHIREAAASYDLRRVERVKQALDRLAAMLVEEPEAKSVLDDIRGTGDDRILHYARQGKFTTRPYVDAYELFDLVAASEALNEETRAAAARTRDAVDALILDSFGMEQGWPQFEAGLHGIFLVFPYQEIWNDLAWYSPRGPQDGGHANGGWAFLADGATPGNGQVESWYELLDAWYDDDTQDPAGRNGYAW